MANDNRAFGSNEGNKQKDAAPKGSQAPNAPNRGQQAENRPQQGTNRPQSPGYQGGGGGTAQPNRPTTQPPTEKPRDIPAKGAPTPYEPKQGERRPDNR